MIVTRSVPKLLARAFTGTWLGVATVALLVGIVLYQRWMLTHPVAVAAVGTLRVGQVLPELRLKDVDGRPAVLKWHGDRRSTIVYIFTPTCVWCKKNMPGMKLVHDKSDGYHFVGISLTEAGLKAYLKKNDISFPAYYAEGDQNNVAPLKISVTPETLIVSPDGVVQNVWLGAYVGKAATQIENKFAVVLPNLGTEVDSRTTNHAGVQER